MEHFAGLDVSVNETSVCIVDDTGKIVREEKVGSEPEALLPVLTSPGYHFERIGLEAGPLSQWLYSGHWPPQRLLVQSDARCLSPPICSPSGTACASGSRRRHGQTQLRPSPNFRAQINSRRPMSRPRLGKLHLSDFKLTH
jgi:hypothetical protein